MSLDETFFKGFKDWKIEDENLRITIIKNIVICGNI